MEITELSPTGGVEIRGVDLSQPIDTALRDRILELFVAHHILVFRDQALTKEQQAAFTENFGELEEHVFRLADGSKSPNVHMVTNLGPEGEPSFKPYTHGNYFWHSDKSYHAVPSLATVLHAVELPPKGGDTQFANMQIAYDALSADRKEALSTLRVVHSFAANRRNTGNRPATVEEIAERPPVTHPLVRTHPATGRKALFLGAHTSHIEGRPEEEGHSFLEALCDTGTKQDNVYTHLWRAGDLVMWDNRCLLHRATANYEMAKYRRILQRTVVKGTEIPR